MVDFRCCLGFQEEIVKLQLRMRIEERGTDLAGPGTPVVGAVAKRKVY